MRSRRRHTTAEGGIKSLGTCEGRATSSCLVSCDHIPRRSWPLFRAKAMLSSLIAGFSSPGIQSHQEQLAA